MDPSCAADIRNQCRRVRAPFFFKQWGGANKKKSDRLLDGRAWSAMPHGAAVPAS
jgi:protein gp37